MILEISNFTKFFLESQTFISQKMENIGHNSSRDLTILLLNNGYYLFLKL